MTLKPIGAAVIKALINYLTTTFESIFVSFSRCSAISLAKSLRGLSFRAIYKERMMNWPYSKKKKYEEPT